LEYSHTFHGHDLPQPLSISAHFKMHIVHILLLPEALSFNWHLIVKDYEFQYLW